MTIAVDLGRKATKPTTTKLFDTLMVFLKEFIEKDDVEKDQQMTRKHEKLPSMQRVKDVYADPMKSRKATKPALNVGPSSAGQRNAI